MKVTQMFIKVKKKDNKQCYNHTIGYFTTFNVNDLHLYKTS